MNQGKPVLSLGFAVTGLLLAPAVAWSQTAHAMTVSAAQAVVKSIATPVQVAAETRLIEIYRLTSAGRASEALHLAETLVRDHPNFQLAQLVYGDLLSARARPVQRFADVPAALTSDQAAVASLSDLHFESQMRLRALREQPPAGAIPSQFLSLSPRNRHAIAIDASRSRLYLFENTPEELKLVADFYISVGKSGIEKKVEGDLRTPLGVYFIVSNLDPKSLSNFYGAGALPINYPNVLDSKRGKTGRGIWLHGTPPNQFSRSPMASDGCVVLSNPDLQHIVKTVEVRTTPVVISPQIDWVLPHHVIDERKPFEEVLSAWRVAKSSGNLDQLLRFYTQDFNSFGKNLAEWTPALRNEIDNGRGRPIQLKDLSFLRWNDGADTMVVTFGEVTEGANSGPTKRQYWTRQGNEWKIFFEGIIG